MQLMHRLGLVTRRALLAVAITTALLITTVGAAVALTPYPSTDVAQLTLTSAVTDAGRPIVGWNWMRSPSYSDEASYLFDDFDPAVLSYDRKMAVVLAPLVTNQTNGGAGWSARVHVTVTYTYPGGSRTWNYHVTATNPFPLRSSLHSGGVGYQTYGKLTLTKSQFTHGAGSLLVQVSRDSAYSTYSFHPHVAVNKGAVSVWYLTTP